MIDVSDRMIGIGSKQNITIPINSLDINDRNFTWALDENFSFELASSRMLQTLATDLGVNRVPQIHCELVQVTKHLLYHDPLGSLAVHKPLTDNVRNIVQSFART